MTGVQTCALRSNSFPLPKNPIQKYVQKQKISKHDVVTKKGEGKRNKPEQDGDGESLRDREEKMTQ